MSSSSYREYFFPAQGLSTVEIENIRKDNLKSVITTARNGKPKSSISQIHECALHMRMNVEFLVINFADFQLLLLSDLFLKVTSTFNSTFFFLHSTNLEFNFYRF